MSTKFNLTEVSLLVSFFVCMTLFNCVQHWEAVEGMAEYDAWELQTRLSLDADQTMQLRSINLSYYETLSNAYQSAADEASYCRRAEAIVKARDKEIQRMLTSRQRKAWSALPCKR